MRNRVDVAAFDFSHRIRPLGRILVLSFASSAQEQHAGLVFENIKEPEQRSEQGYQLPVVLERVSATALNRRRSVAAGALVGVDLR